MSLNGSSYIELPTELRNPKKGLINIKNQDNECFRWCHIRMVNPTNKHPERVKKEDKKMIEKLDYSGIEFPISKKDYNKIEKKNGIRESTFLVMRTSNHFQYIYLKRISKWN